MVPSAGDAVCCVLQLLRASRVVLSAGDAAHRLVELHPVYGGVTAVVLAFDDRPAALAVRVVAEGVGGAVTGHERRVTPAAGHLNPQHQTERERERERRRSDVAYEDFKCSI